jgi:hypothetical protein
MKLNYPLEKLPSVASQVVWAKLLDISITTMYRAEKKGRLKTGIRSNSRDKFYTKDQILAWLGIPLPHAPKRSSGKTPLKSKRN